MKFRLLLISSILAFLFLFTGCNSNESVATDETSSVTQQSVETENQTADGEVNAKESAIQIAQEYVKKKYDNDFSEYVIGVTSDEDTWTVFYYLKPQNEDEAILGGGGPSVEINKSTGEVISCYLQE